MAGSPVPHQTAVCSGCEIWIFGFGSLVHTPGFEYEGRIAGFIKGFRRVWWQGSTDHRGTPEAPGRTVTLVKEAGASTWGMAYRLSGTPEQQRATLAYLEWREKQYDLRQPVDVYCDDAVNPAVRGALCYIASADSSNYLGPAPLADIAQQIATARGPSGPNWAYLTKLASAMRSLGVEDEELFLLERSVRQALKAGGGSVADSDDGDAIPASAVGSMGAVAGEASGAVETAANGAGNAVAPQRLSLE